MLPTCTKTHRGLCSPIPLLVVGIVAGSGCRNAEGRLASLHDTDPVVTVEDTEERSDPCEEGSEDTAADQGSMSSIWPNTGHDTKHTGRVCRASFDCVLAPGWVKDVPDGGYGGIVIAGRTDHEIIIGGADEQVFAFDTDGIPFGDPIDVAAWALSNGVTVSDDPESAVYGIDTTPVVSKAGFAYFFTQSGHEVRIRIDAEQLAVDGISAVVSGDQRFNGVFFNASPIMDDDGDIFVQTSSALLGELGGLMKLNTDGVVLWGSPLLGEGSAAINDADDLVVVSSGKVAIVSRQTGEILKQTYSPLPAGNPEWASLPAAVRDAYRAHPGTQIIQDTTIVTGSLSGSAVIDPQDGSVYLTKANSREGLVSLTPELRLRWAADPQDSIGKFYAPDAENPHCGNVECYAHGLPSWSSAATPAIGIDRVYVLFRVYVGHSDAWFGAFAKSDGRSLWKKRLGMENFDSMRSQPVVDRNGNVAIAVNIKDDNYKDVAQLMLFDPDGDLLAAHDIDGQTFDGPIANAQGDIFVRANNLYQFAKDCQ